MSTFKLQKNIKKGQKVGKEDKMLKGGRPPTGEDKFAERRKRRTNYEKEDVLPKGGQLACLVLLLNPTICP